jgi:hypothetical protein
LLGSQLDQTVPEESFIQDKSSLNNESALDEPSQEVTRLRDLINDYEEDNEIDFGNEISRPDSDHLGRFLR